MALLEASQSQVWMKQDVGEPREILDLIHCCYLQVGSLLELELLVLCKGAVLMMCGGAR